MEQLLDQLNKIIPQIETEMEKGLQQLKKVSTDEEFNQAKQFISDYKKLMLENRIAEANALKEKYLKNGN